MTRTIAPEAEPTHVERINPTPPGHSLAAAYVRGPRPTESLPREATVLELTRTLLEIRALHALGVPGIVVAPEIFAAAVDERAAFREKLSGTQPDPAKMAEVAAALVPAKIILATAVNALTRSRGTSAPPVAAPGLRSASEPTTDPLALTDAILALPLDAAVPHDAVQAAVTEIGHAQSGTAPSVGEAMGIKAAGDLVGQVKAAGPDPAVVAQREADEKAAAEQAEKNNALAAQVSAEKAADLEPGAHGGAAATGFNTIGSRGTPGPDVHQPGTTIG
jgi:hypothetical protein